MTTDVGKLRMARVVIFLACINLCLGCSRLVLRSADINVVQHNAIGYFLPKGLVHLKMTKNEKGDYELVIESKLVPDEDTLYTFRYDPASWADDNVNIAVGQNGLLQSVTTTTHDKSVEISKKTIAIAKEVVKAVTGFAPKGKVVEKGITLPKEINVVLNPDDKTEIDNFAKRLKKISIDFKLEPLFETKSYLKLDSNLPTSLYYRPLLPYRISLSPSAPQPGSSDQASDDWVERAEVIYLPSKTGPTLSLAVNRAPFVNKVTTLTFTDGILVGLTINKPSEIEAALDIPLELAKAIASLPTDLIQFKIDLTQKDTALVQEKTKAIQAQQELIKAQQQLIKLQQEMMPPKTTTGTTTGGSTGGSTDAPPLN